MGLFRQAANEQDLLEYWIVNPVGKIHCAKEDNAIIDPMRKMLWRDNLPPHKQDSLALKPKDDEDITAAMKWRFATEDEILAEQLRLEEISKREVAKQERRRKLQEQAELLQLAPPPQAKKAEK